jgi:glycosyltransferase involved in cell wall biosynthesis
MTNISVVTPAYNREDEIVRCMDSVQSQTYTDAEHIVVDDGSSDDTWSIINSYESEKIPVNTISFEKNRGANTARNAAISEAKGNIIAFLDSDDSCFSNRLKRIAEEFTSLDSDFAGVAHGYSVASSHNLANKVRPPHGEIEFDDILHGNSIGGLSCVAIRKSNIQEVGLLDPDLPSAQDIDLYIRLLYKYKFFGISDVLIEYNRQPNSISNNIGSIRAGQEAIWQKHQDALPRSFRANQYHYLGRIYADKDEMSKARRYFIKSLRQDLDPIVGVHFLLALGGRSAFDIGRSAMHRINQLLLN